MAAHTGPANQVASSLPCHLVFSGAQLEWPERELKIRSQRCRVSPLAPKDRDGGTFPSPQAQKEGLQGGPPMSVTSDPTPESASHRSGCARQHHFSERWAHLMLTMCQRWVLGPNVTEEETETEGS